MPDPHSGLRAVVIRIDAANRVELYTEDDSPTWSSAHAAVGQLSPDYKIQHPHLGDALTGPEVLDEAQRNTSRQTLERAGEYLFHLLDNSGIGNAWTAFRTRHPGSNTAGGGIRTVLEIENPTLQQWNWELIGCTRQPAFLDPVNSIVRARRDPHCGCGRITWPLRVLVIVGARADDKDIEWMDEIEGLDDAFHTRRQVIDIEVLRQPAQAALSAFYRDYRPHVVHFIGHAEHRAPNGSALQMWESDTAMLPVNPTMWSNLLAQHPPHLVFLNACRTADREPLVAGLDFVAACFRAHAQAVITMRGDVRGEPSATFAKSFYEELVEGKAIDVAMSRARNELVGMPTLGPYRLDWSFPVLEVSQTERAGSVFAFERCDAPAHQKAEAAFPLMYRFVDRTIQRRQVFSAIDPAPATLQPPIQRHLLVVHGEPDIGKTSVLSWGLEGCARRDYLCVHVDFSPDEVPRTASFIDVLRRIRDGLPADDPRFGEYRAAFNRFTWVLNRELGDLASQGPEPPAANISDLWLEVPTITSERMIPTIFEAFRAALARAAQHTPLVIALDHLGSPGAGVDAVHFKEFLRPHLIDLIAQGHLRQVRIVLVVDSREHVQFGIGALEARAHVVPVPRFAASEYVPLQRLFTRRLNLRGPKVTQMIEDSQPADPWTPRSLLLIEELARTHKLGQNS